MKKFVFVFSVVTLGALCALSAFAQQKPELPTKEEAARVIEGFWNAVGHSTAEKLSEELFKYTNDKRLLQDIRANVTVLPKERIMKLRNYKAEITRIVLDTNLGRRVIVCYYNGYDAANDRVMQQGFYFKKEGGTWKLQ